MRVSITLQIGQTEIVNWKYGFSGNSKMEDIAKLQWKQILFAFTGHMVYVKLTWSFFNVL